MVILLHSPDEEHEKRLQGVYTSLLDKHSLFLCKCVHIFSRKHLYYISTSDSEDRMIRNICSAKLVLVLQFIFRSLNLNNVFQTFKCFVFAISLASF